MAGRCGGLRDKKQMELMFQQACCTQALGSSSTGKCHWCPAPLACFSFTYTFKSRGGMHPALLSEGDSLED